MNEKGKKLELTCTQTKSNRNQGKVSYVVTKRPENCQYSSQHQRSIVHKHHIGPWSVCNPTSHYPAKGI